MIIHAERDSVCAGDDCNAPNAKDIMLDTRARVSELLEKAAEHVVQGMYGSVWAVMKDNKKSNKILGYVIFGDEDGNRECELAVPEENVQMLGIDKIFCRYFHRTRTVWRDEGIKKLEELHPQCEQLIDMVKAELEYEKSKTV